MNSLPSSLLHDQQCIESRLKAPPQSASTTLTTRTNDAMSVPIWILILSTHLFFCTVWFGNAEVFLDCIFLEHAVWTDECILPFLMIGILFFNFSSVYQNVVSQKVDSFYFHEWVFFPGSEDSCYALLIPSPLKLVFYFLYILAGISADARSTLGRFFF